MPDISITQALLGKVIEEVSFANGYYSIRFSDGSGINVFNYVGDYGNPGNVGAKVIAVREGDHKISIDLDCLRAIQISLKEEDYNSLEAFEYFDPSKGIFMVD